MVIKKLVDMFRVVDAAGRPCGYFNTDMTEKMVLAYAKRRDGSGYDRCPFDGGASWHKPAHKGPHKVARYSLNGFIDCPVKEKKAPKP